MTHVAINPATEITTLVEDFNRIIKSMVLKLVTLYPTDPRIDRAKKRVMLAVDIDPISIMHNVGPYLYKYRTQIYAGNDQFFIDNTYDAEFAESVDAEKADLSAYIMPKAKCAWRESGSLERHTYKETVQELLDLYVEYLALTIG